MGLLSGEFTEQDLAFDETKLTDPKKFKRGTFADIGLGVVSGVAKGVNSVANAGSRFVEGDEVADKRQHQFNQATTPLNQGHAGHIASGIAEVVTAGAVGSAGGALGVAATVGLGTRAMEHTKLTQTLGVDQDTADTASNIYGTTNAVLAGLPISNVFRSTITDYAALVVAPTITGQGMTYVEGSYLDSQGYKKQGQMYKDMSTDPTAIGMNLGIGSIFFLGGRLTRTQADPNATQTDVAQAEAHLMDAVDQATADVDRASIPTIAENAGDLIQHQDNINLAIDQVMKGEKVNIEQATGGQFKTLNDIRNYIQTKNKTNNTPIIKTKNTTKQTSNTVPKITFNIKAEVSKSQPQRINDSYHAAQQAGFSPSQARALVGELGRENDFNLDTMFGSHKDEANHKKNRGIFSWQDSSPNNGRATNLHNHMRTKGLVSSNGTFKRTNESLQAQFEFLRKEIESNPKWKASFLDKKNITNEEARAALGGKGTIIGWARGQSILKSGKAFDWKSQEAKANKYSDMFDEQPTTLAHIADDVAEQIALPVRDLSNLDATVHRTDLDNFPDLTLEFISLHDIAAFETRHTTFNNEIKDTSFNMKDDLSYMTNDLDVKNNIDMFGADFHNALNTALAPLIKASEETAIPHTAKGVQVKDRVNDPAKDFKPDESIATEWKTTQRFEDKKYHDQLTRSFKDKDGNTVQELKYRSSYVSRVVNPAHQTHSIHVGRSGKSDFVDHKGNKELETALDRVFEDRAYGYLSQIPKGQEAITKLKDNPNLVISSRKTGEDLTAAQWQQKLQREQDNIQMMAKAMSTLAKCALKQAA